MMSVKTLRAIGIGIPLFTGLLFWGITKGIFGVEASTNIASTGVTVGFIFGALNFYLSWLVYKHRIP